MIASLRRKQKKRLIPPPLVLFKFGFCFVFLLFSDTTNYERRKDMLPVMTMTKNLILFSSPCGFTSPVLDNECSGTALRMSSVVEANHGQYGTNLFFFFREMTTECFYMICQRRGARSAKKFQDDIDTHCAALSIALNYVIMTAQKIGINVLTTS